MRIPLIVRWKGHFPTNRVINTPVINTDWLPTILKLTGLKIPGGLDGENISKLFFSGKDTGSKRRFYFHFPHYTNQGGRPGGAVIEGKWKLIENYEDGSLELYDLETDVGETRNLISAEPRIARRLHNALIEWRRNSNVQTNSVNPEFNPELHRRLYLDTDPSLFNPATASGEAIEAMQQWRKLMNSVVKMR